MTDETRWFSRDCMRIWIERSKHLKGWVRGAPLHQEPGPRPGQAVLHPHASRSLRRPKTHSPSQPTTHSLRLLTTHLIGLSQILWPSRKPLNHRLLRTTHSINSTRTRHLHSLSRACRFPSHCSLTLLVDIRIRQAPCSTLHIRGPIRLRSQRHSRGLPMLPRLSQWTIATIHSTRHRRSRKVAWLIRHTPTLMHRKRTLSSTLRLKTNKCSRNSNK